MEPYDGSATVRSVAGELFQRHPENPILTAARWPYPCNVVFNPAAARLASGETVLVVRVEDLTGASHLTVARSQDGFTDWAIDEAPTLMPEPEDHPEEVWGLEDPRVVWIEELDRFALTYTAYSQDGPLVALALTHDFKTFERKGPIMPPDDKNAALFPRRFGGRWLLFHRPTSARPDQHAHVWASFSPDLKHWSDPCSVMRTRTGPAWDHVRAGLGPPPVETSEGWLLIYHGVRATVAGDIYRVGLALLDLENPCRVLRRGDAWVLGPRAPYERVGDVPNVVFPCGTVYDEATDELRLYYGAADTSVAVATAQLSDLVQWLQDQPA